jgi:aromatic ring hydroxylase
LVVLQNVVIPWENTLSREWSLSSVLVLHRCSYIKN